jgi:hypothetical protein
MTENLDTVCDVIAHLKDPSPRAGRLCPMLNTEDNSLHIGIYTGMGEFDSRPLTQFKSAIKVAVETMYEERQLIPGGQPFTYYSGGPLFIKLCYCDNNT